METSLKDQVVELEGQSSVKYQLQNQPLLDDQHGSLIDEGDSPLVWLIETEAYRDDPKLGRVRYRMREVASLRFPTRRH